MSGFNFGGFDLASGLGSLSEIGDKLQRLKEDVENSIDSSLRADRTEQHDQESRADADAGPDWFGGMLRTLVTVNEDNVNEDSEGDGLYEDADVYLAAMASQKPADAPPSESEPHTADIPAPKSTKVTQNDSTSQHVPPPEKAIEAPEQPPVDAFTEAAAVVADGLEAAAAESTTVLRDEESPPMDTALVDEDVSQLKAPALRDLVHRLRETLQGREAQIERQAAEAARHTEAVAALTKRNEELAMAQAKVSERDLVAMQREFESHLAEADRKIKALTNERDNFQRTANSKDEEIKQVMAEGEALSKKQLKQETTIKQLRGKIKELQDATEDLHSKLEVWQGKATAAEAARTEATSKVAAQHEQHAEALAAERQHFERLLEEAKSAAAAADKRANEAAKAGTARKLRDAELRAETLEVTVQQLQEELERRRAAGDEREELLSAEVSELQRRCSEAEARQQELQARLPEATAPLLRQLEAMQAAAEEQAAAVAAAEAVLYSKIAAAEIAAQKAAAETAATGAALVEAQSRNESWEAQLAEVRLALRTAQEATLAERRAREAAEARVENLKAEVTVARDSLATLESMHLQQMEAVRARESQALETVAALREELLKARDTAGSAEGVGTITGFSTAGDGSLSGAHLSGPPAIPAEGFRWVMVRDNNSSSPTKSGVEAGSKQGDAPDGSEDLWGTPPKLGLGLVSAMARISSTMDDAAHAVASQRAIKELESTRDQLTSELVRAEREAAAGRAAMVRAAALENDLAAVHSRYISAMELLGEREERIEELVADLIDMRDGYRQQLAVLADQLATSRSTDS